MRVIVAAIPLLITVVLAGCGGGSDHTYPQEIVDNFIASCRQKGTQVGCECAIDRIQRRFALAEFQKLEERTARGEVPPELMNAIADCPTS